jgi:basic membrane lipoprotein Med (substrate-binding protein (PBP1-ABC) superfamily)
MIKRVETSVLYGLNAVRNGNFSGGILRFGLDADGVGYTTTNISLTPDIIAQMEDARRKIISGEVRVAATHAEARQIPGFPQHLRALDD